MINRLNEWRAVRALRRIDAGMDPLRRVDDGETDHPEWESESGWRFRVFDDIGGWDYIDAYAPPNRGWREAKPLGRLFYYHPDRRTLREVWKWSVDGASPGGYITS